MVLLKCWNTRKTQAAGAQSSCAHPAGTSLISCLLRGAGKQVSEAPVKRLECLPHISSCCGPQCSKYLLIHRTYWTLFILAVAVLERGKEDAGAGTLVCSVARL